ncbi:hypothetical protein PVAND_017560 [Polypedilum vanderplanki]|uniref:Uncharacterized protein n=1 Tax=Polypedilum vanderplanki TaxID=319348 RepID=A0A9J6BIN1_POLVA|nr:hypothetical protein PVAND_017560 [Polypedilum vanderplanki]
MSKLIKIIADLPVKICVQIRQRERQSKIFFRILAVDGGVPFASKSSFRYEVIAPRMRLKRDVLFSYEDLIVSFGGVAALFLGLDFWGLSEFGYYLMTTFFKYLIHRIVLKVWVKKNNIVKVKPMNEKN